MTTLGHYGPRVLVRQTDALGYKPGRETLIASDLVGDPIIFVPATRPSIRFPITEFIAAEAGIDLWYFDPEKWPERVPVDPVEYLGIPYAERP